MQWKWATEVEIKKKRTASFHELNPAKTAKDLSSLLCTAAWVAKAVG